MASIPSGRSQVLGSLQVIYKSSGAEEPDNSLRDINQGEDDINYQMRGDFVYLVPKWTDDYRNAPTNYRFKRTNEELPGKQDLAKGAGGDYRYLIPGQEPGTDLRITRVALYRKSGSAVTIDEVTSRGYTDFTTDINAGRDGTFLHLIWKTELYF